MQLPTYWISEGFIGLALIAAALVMFNYTRKRVAQLPPEERGAGTPLNLSAVGVLVLGIASLIRNYNETNPGVFHSGLLASYYATAMVGAFILTIAALMILGRRQMYAIPTVLLAIGLVMAAVIILGFSTELLNTAVGILIVILCFAPAGLFLYLSYTTRRVTSVSFAVVLLIYPLYPLFSLFSSNTLITLLLVAIRLYAPALLLVAFYRPELGISGEFWGYGAAFAVVAMWISVIVSYSPALMTVYVFSLTALAVGCAIGLGTAAYVYGRYARSRNRTTLLLSVFFILAALEFLLPTLDHMMTINNNLFIYAYLTIGLLTVMLLNIGAFLALDWKKLSWVPILIGLPALGYIWYFFYINPRFNPLFLQDIGLWTNVTTIVQSVIPLILYLGLGYRIWKSGGGGYMRPIFLGIGIVFLMLGSLGGDTTTLQVAVLLLIAFVVWAFGTAGWADKYLGKQ
jgi:hypothetical protein